METKIINNILEEVQGDMKYLQEIINCLQKIVDITTNDKIREIDFDDSGMVDLDDLESEDD